jgi:hypothetical protein
MYVNYHGVTSEVCLRMGKVSDPSLKRVVQSNPSPYAFDMISGAMDQ